MKSSAAYHTLRRSYHFVHEDDGEATPSRPLAGLLVLSVEAPETGPHHSRMNFDVGIGLWSIYGFSEDCPPSLPPGMTFVAPRGAYVFHDGRGFGREGMVHFPRQFILTTLRDYSVTPLEETLILASVEDSLLSGAEDLKELLLPHELDGVHWLSLQDELNRRLAGPLSR